VCELYSGKAKITPKLSNKLRIEIEKFIGYKYKHLNEKYKDSSFNGARYRGWVDLQISKNNTKVNVGNTDVGEMPNSKQRYNVKYISKKADF